jgi:DNA polymerase elongation subunit (family B)
MPQKGIFHNVCVFDFSSMYTTIYITFNISPDTYMGSDKYCLENFAEIKQKYGVNSYDDLIKIKNDFEVSCFLPHYCKIGVLPSLELELLTKRDEMKKARDKFEPGTPEYRILESEQGIFKEVLNSLYGVSSFEYFILFNQYVSASITAIARELIHHILENAKFQKYVPRYGDTDSCFISLRGNTIQEVVEEAKFFEGFLNSTWVDFVKKHSSAEVPKEYMKLNVEFEKAFSKLFFSDVKKRYFGFLGFYKGKLLQKSKLSVTGFETRRDDTPKFFKEQLFKAYENVLSDNPRDNLYKQYKEMKEEITHTAPDDLVINVRLSKNIEDYEKSTPIHVTAVKNSHLNVKRGDRVRMIYVHGVEKNVIHYETGELKHTIDYEMYIEKFFTNKLTSLNSEWELLFSPQKTLDVWSK